MLFISQVVLLLVAFVNCAVEKESEEIGDFWKEHENEVIQFEGLVCPKEYHRLPIFAYKCNADEDCVEFGGVCCREKNWKICRQGVYKKKKEPKHAPFLPGIPRMCPTKEAVVEVLPVQKCKTDKECSPRICCPDGQFSYCRTPIPHVGETFIPRIMKSFKMVMSYLQCSSPPPPLLDFFPKPCKNSIDCFPNLCCQERGKKVCRPPKRSLLKSFPTLT